MGKRQSVIITGASSGIGTALALAFARRGFSVGLTARRSELLAQIADNCRKQGATVAEWRAADACDSERFRKALGELDEHLGGAGLFVANAGLGGEFSPYHDLGAQARDVLSINALAAIDGLEFMKGRMISRREGRLVGVSSIAGLRGLPMAAPYSASKAALRVYLEAIRMELGAQGVGVTDITPGFIRTPATAGMKNAPFMMDADAAAEVFVRDILRGRSVSVAPWQFRPVYWLLRWLPDGILHPLLRLGLRKPSS